MARAEPTIVASSPIARCRKPPTLALAYISPARSSKRRMSIMVCSHLRATLRSGSGCSAIRCRTLAQGRGRSPAVRRSLTPVTNERVPNGPWLVAQVGVALERGPALEELARIQRVEVGADHGG